MSARAFCGHCSGTGRCAVCDGTGSQFVGFNGRQLRQPCTACAGVGTCNWCKAATGRGWALPPLAPDWTSGARKAFRVRDPVRRDTGTN